MRTRDLLSLRPTSEALEASGILVAIAVAYRGLDIVVMNAYGLPQAAFASDVLGPRALAHLLTADAGAWPLVLRGSVLLILFGMFWVGRTTIFGDWSSLDGASRLRPLLLSTAAVLTWQLASYNYNLFFDRPHLIDRAVLIGLCVCAYRRPIFLLPLLGEAIAVMAQFQYPLGVFRYTQPILIVRFIELFLTVWILGSITRRVKPIHFVALGLVLIAATYLRSGLGKLAIGWLSYGHVYNLLFATFGTGWLGFLDPQDIVQIGRVLRSFDWLMVGGTLVVEVGIAACFWSRRVAATFLVLGVLFHVAVFALSGICFWQWAVLDIVFAATLLLWKGSPEAESLFSRPRFLINTALVCVGVVWFQPGGLHWFDSPLNYSYRFTAVDTDEREQRLPGEFFEPYGYEFAIGAFTAYTEEKALPIYWGASFSREVVDQLTAAKSETEIAEVEDRLGSVEADEAHAMLIDSFLRRWATNWNRRRSTRTAFSILPAPRQLWTGLGIPRVGANQEIREIRAYRVKTWFDGESYREFGETLVRRIDVP